MTISVGNNSEEPTQLTVTSPVVVTAHPPSLQRPNEPVAPFGAEPAASQFRFAPVVFSHFTPPPPPESSTSEAPRRVGRPKGSKNRTSRAPTIEIGPKRPPGRPRGSGKRQREHLDDEQPQPKRPRGRPRKTVVTDPIGGVTIDFGNFTVPGTQASRHPTATALPSVGTSALRIIAAAPEVPARASECTTSAVVALEPGEDPQQVILDHNDRAGSNEADDEGMEGDDGRCLEDEAGGEGIGVEDEICVGEDGEDEADPAEEQPDDPSTLPHASGKRKPLPPWLLDAFNNATLLRNIYDSFIEKHRTEMRQHTAMLPLTVGALDHSHKFTKHVARVNGERLFAGLLTVTNENGEIRTCHLVTTTGHSQSLLALSEISRSLELYGHEQPHVLFTDNVSGDKNLLEGVFSSSLRQDVIGIEEYAHLEELQIPANTSIMVKNTASAINLACQIIMDDLPQDGNLKLVVGFDSEWNVNFSAGDRICHRGPTAVVQLAYKNRIFIFQVGDMIANGTLPSQLRVLLENPNILKVGRLIDADLKNLQAACHSTVPFVGALDLAKLAKQRCVVHKIRTTSLSDLCARVLHKRLNKNVSERISSAWESPVLTEEQIRYAALDAYASLRIFEVLNLLQPPQALIGETSGTTALGTHVMLRASDRGPFIAAGTITQPSSPLLPGSVSVKVSEILCGAAKLRSHRNQALVDFGRPPFTIVYPLSYLVTYSYVAQPPSRPSNDTQPQRLPPLEAPSSDDSWFDSALQAATESHEIDQAALVDGEGTLGPQAIQWPAEPKVRSRVIKDAFHLMNMFNVPRRHGCSDAFNQALRDAIFIPDTQDANRIAVWGSSQTPPVTFNELRQWRSTWLWKRCKRFIPPPEILYPRVYKVLKTFGPLKDATTGSPLFDSARWKIAKNVLDLIYRGFASDPPGVPLYTTLGLDKKTNLPLYRCFRGTNMTEGGVHTHLRPHLPTSGASLRHVEAALLDFVLYHNLTVGTFNTTGHRYHGHYSIWISNEITELRIFLKDVLTGPCAGDPPWVNGNLFKQSTEVPVGVLPVPKDVRDANGLSEYVEGLHSSRHSRSYDFLAKLQGTRKPIVPVHTPAEHALFRDLMQESPDFSIKANGPDWKRAVRLWNAKADECEGIYYKLAEQLQSYFSHWKTRVNAKESLSLADNIVPSNLIPSLLGSSQ
ncbi:hypothetical protein EST38_g12781 [Candolleomyces aberdarensis]|uniref:3'-5' exonuclease n=1 Tax=Candolleomyces aberdarensis TaxID=2316362 RepID=A0A4Q2D1K9_9AGAR|nr:hypothetical protein EST38_g12781 [Candolleomyces aberdarensis]